MIYILLITYLASYGVMLGLSCYVYYKYYYDTRTIPTTIQRYYEPEIIQINTYDEDARMA